MKSYFTLIIILTAYCTFFTSAQGANRVLMRSYKHVLITDTDLEAWRPLHALARIIYHGDSLSISIWHYWASESANPLAHIKLSSQARKNTTTGRWHYTGTLFRTLGTGNKCHVESYSEITANKNHDFTITIVNDSVRYRLSRKAPRKPRKP